MVVSGKAKIGNKLYDVTDLETYSRNPDAFLNGFVAIRDGSYVLPVIPSNSPSGTVGVEVGNTVARVHLPTTDEDQYSVDNMIDFNQISSMSDLVNAQDTITGLEKEILTSPDSASHYAISEKDSPAMRLLKEAVNAKNIDLDKYEHRFGSNYNNDKRIFQKNTVSLGMMERMANALDLQLTITLRDMNSDVPNPMGKEMSIDLIGGDEDE